MIADRHEIARLQSDFFRDQFRKFLKYLLISIVINFLLLVGIIYLILFQPSRLYYANTTEGRVLPMPPAVDMSVVSKG